MFLWRTYITKVLILNISICIVLIPGITATAQGSSINPKGHSDEVSAVCFTPDGKLVVSGSYDGTIKLWNASTGAFIRNITKCENQITEVTVDSNGKTAALTDTCGVIELRNLATGKKLQTLKSGMSMPDMLSFISSEKLLIGSYIEDRAKLLSIKTGKCLKEIKGKSVVVDNNLKYMAKRSSKGRVALINQSTGKQIAMLTADEPRLFSQNGTVLATVTGEGDADGANPTDTIKIWDVATGKLLSQVAYMNGVLAFDRQGSKILIVNGECLSLVHMININDIKCSLSIDSRQYYASSGAFSRDGKMVAIGGADGGIVIWDIAKNAQVCDIKGSKPANYEGE